MTTLTGDGLRAIDRAAALAKRLMAFGSPGPSTLSRVEINQCARELAPLLRWAVGPNISLDLSLDTHLLETWCDPRDLENALINLAINARDAMTNGGLLALYTFKA